MIGLLCTRGNHQNHSVSCTRTTLWLKPMKIFVVRYENLNDIIRNRRSIQRRKKKNDEGMKKKNNEDMKRER